jgi:thymidylate synthase
MSEQYTSTASTMGEEQYLMLMQQIMTKGIHRPNRTGVATRSLFGQQVRFIISGYRLPRLTTRDISLRVAFEELMFFLRGDTNVKHLMEKNVHIWDGNTSRESLNKLGLVEVPEHSMPFGYGHQWRNFGGSWTPSQDDDDSQHIEGYDQVANVLHLLKNDPYSRRIILTSWNPCQVPHMALPPCHIMYQWLVDTDKRVTCILTMRSNDLPLGFPTNVLTASLMTFMFCKACGLEPGELVVNMHDAHIYDNQVDVAREQVTRQPYSQPTLRINKELNSLDDILSLEYSDLECLDYVHHPQLKYPFTV